VILQQPVSREQMTKLLASGASDLLEGFVSNKTRRKFKARLEWDAKEGKVVFAFEPRPQRGPAAKKAATRATSVGLASAASIDAAAPAAAKTVATKTTAKTVVKKAAAKKTAARKAAAKKTTSARAGSSDAGDDAQG
jgi:DNA topoisomerase-3